MWTETNLYKSGKTENVILRRLLLQHQSTGVAFDDGKSFHIILFERKWQPTPVFLPGEFHGQRSLAATVHGVAES